MYAALVQIVRICPVLFQSKCRYTWDSLSYGTFLEVDRVSDWIT